MNEIGKLLSEKRIQQGLEIEQVARETNIARHYLEALENDNYDIFPGEPYVIGFLRNYCDHLNLNADEIVNLYKQIKIQETNVPTDALLPPKRFLFTRRNKVVLTVILAFLLASVLLFFVISKVYPLFKDSIAHKRQRQTAEVIEVRQPASYRIDAERFEKRLFENDEIIIGVDNSDYDLKIEKISDFVVLNTNIGQQILNLGHTLKLDFNNDLIIDAEITLSDIEKNNPEAGVVLSVLIGGEIQKKDDEKQNEVVTSDNSSQLKKGSYKVLFESGSAYPVTLNAAFRSYCLFRHESDKSNREERYYQKSEQLTVQANNGFRIWASNGNAVKIQLVAGGKTVDLEVSKPGEIIVKELKWIKDDESKRFKFVVIDVD